MVFSTKSGDADQNNADIYIDIDEMLRLRHSAKDLSLARNKKSVALVDGDSRTQFRGRGMEFAEVRPYQPGDDIRNIDWRVTARTQTTYTKLFQEERERPVYLLVDQRASMFFGSENQFKSTMAARLAAIIGWTAMANNDRIGALIFSDTEQTDSKARRGKHAVLNLIHHLQQYNHALQSPIANERQHHMIDMLQDIRRVAKPGSAIFVISDFHDFTEACAEPLSMLARHSDVTCIQVFDGLEKSLPPIGQLTISNGQQKLTVSGSSASFSQSFTQSFEATQSILRKACTNTACAFALAPVTQHAVTLAQDLFTHKRQHSARRSS